MLFRRPLLPCILAYATGLWVVHDLYHSWSLAAYILMGAIFVVSCIVLYFSRSPTVLYLIALALLGATVMGHREQQSRKAYDLITLLDSPGARVIQGTVTAVTDISDTDRSRVLLKDVTVSSGSQLFYLPGKVQVTLGSQSVAPSAGHLVSGIRIVFPGQVFLPSALNNFFGYDRLEALRHEQVYATAKPIAFKGIVRLVKESEGIGSTISRALVKFRQQVTLSLRESMWPRESRLMTAMLFNDLRQLSENEKLIFRDSGTFHIFAVSGMHVSILALILNMLLRVVRIGLRTSWVITALVLFFYLWVIDFVPSATRSYLMLLAFTAGYALRREVDGITALIFAVAAVLIYDPAALWKAGFVLSVVGVASIVIFTPLLRLWFPWPGERPDLSFWGRRLADVTDVLLATVAIAIVMFPLQLYYFGFWNILSPLANLCQAILAGAVLSAGLLTIAASYVNTVFGEIAGQSASVLMRMVYKISQWASDERWAILYVRQIPTWVMLTGYFFLLNGYYLVFRDTAEFRLKSRARFATHACLGVGLLVIFQFFSELRRPALELWALDVGQGDATLVRLPSGETMLIDGGKSIPDMGRTVIVQQLRGLGIKRLDYVVATHDDDDHTGGLASVIRYIGTRNLLLPMGMEPKSWSTKNMINAAKKHHCVIQEVSAGYTAKAGDAVIEVLNPVFRSFSNNSALTNEDILPVASGVRLPSARTPSDNDESIVMRISYGQFQVLLMGDAGFTVESRLLIEGAISHATVIKAGHHGSKSSTGREFLLAARPKVAFISCGAGNQFGHPSKDVLSRLADLDTQVFRTDAQGAIHIETDGVDVSVRTRSKSSAEYH